LGKLTFTYRRNEDVIDSATGPGSGNGDDGIAFSRRKTKRERSDRDR
jgi:hypothetical protein